MSEVNSNEKHESKRESEANRNYSPGLYKPKKEL